MANDSSILEMSRAELDDAMLRREWRVMDWAANYYDLAEGLNLANEQEG